MGFLFICHIEKCWRKRFLITEQKNNDSFPGTYKVSIVPTVGELMRPIKMPLSVFVAEQEKLRGMHDESITITHHPGINITQKVYEVANVGLIDTNKEEIRLVPRNQIDT